MKTRQDSTGLTNDVMTYTRSHAREITQLPDPSEEWLVRDTNTTYDLIARMQAFHKKGIIKRLEYVYRDNAGGYISRWKTDPTVYDVATRITESEKEHAPFPCGHNSIQNERGVEGLTCGVCGNVYDKSEVDHGN